MAIKKFKESDDDEHVEDFKFIMLGQENSAKGNQNSEVAQT